MARARPGLAGSIWVQLLNRFGACLTLSRVGFEFFLYLFSFCTNELIKEVA